MNNLLACEPPLICLVRHGESEFTAARRYNGTTDAPLTQNGEQAAIQLATVLAEVGWEEVLCSDLSRARRTAELAGFAEPRVRRELRECDYGEYEGKTTAEIQIANPDWDFWRDGCPGGESPDLVADRLALLVSQLRGQHGRALIFSHSHAIRILSALLLGLDARQGAIFSLEPARVNVVRIHRGRPEIALWNDGSHIPSGSAAITRGRGAKHE